MSRALLDTNIIIHRENIKPTNYSIGQLFYWLDKLNYEKVIHPLTITELQKFKDSNMQSLYKAKLSAYTVMKNIACQTTDFKDTLADLPKSENDAIDNQLLCEIYLGRVDILITEDRKMIAKAEKLSLADKVFSINSFISKCINDNPELIDYKYLRVKKVSIGSIDVNNRFFDTFRGAYDDFNQWFARKCDEDAYICKNDKNDILGFLYLKTEDESENYNDINPPFIPKRRLKVGTFKVEASGFRLGERFIKIIFDNAQERNLDEIYVTLFLDRPELKLLKDLLCRWGFVEYGTKTTNGKSKIVLIKNLNEYKKAWSPKQNFPNVIKTSKKFFLPILPEYHTSLLPDSQLNTENEVDFLGTEPHRYALQKVYISFSYHRNMKPGDYILIYRNGKSSEIKRYKSVVTTIGIIDEVKSDFKDMNEYLKYCGNRTVFSEKELKKFWENNKDKLLVVKFIYVKSLTKRLNLDSLWNLNIVQKSKGPRPFDQICDSDFETILQKSNTDIIYCDNIINN